MAGGPIFAHSIYHADTAGRTWNGYYAGGGGNTSPHDEGIQVKASLDANATVEMRFAVPPSVPTGTMKLRALWLANATTGTVKYTIQDANVAAGSSPSAASLTSEAQSSETWSTGNTDEYMEVKTALTPTPSGNDTMVVAVTFDTSGWTLAVVATVIFSLIWE